MKISIAYSMKWVFFSTLVLIACVYTVHAESGEAAPSIRHASDQWVENGSSDWMDEVGRREKQIADFLQDTDPERASQYRFRDGHYPALAWNWFDQHPIGYGGIPYVLLQTMLSLDPSTETDPHLKKLANIWKRESVVADEKGKGIFTLDHLGFGPHPDDYENGIAKPANQRNQFLPNGFVYDPDVEPEDVWFVNKRLKIMRDGFVGSFAKRLSPDYEPKIGKLLILAHAKFRDKLMDNEIDYDTEVHKMQEAPKTDAVFFSCSGCHQGRVIVGGELDKEGNITRRGAMKFLPGMPNTEIEAQYYSKLLMLSGFALIESGFDIEADSLPETPDQIKPSSKAILALYTRMLTRAIDPELVKTIYGPDDEQIERARLQTHAVAKDFPKYISDLIGVAVKTQYIYYQIARQNAFASDNPLKQSTDQMMPDVIGDRIGQMDAFGIASGLVAIHALRPDNSYIKFMAQDNPDNPIFTGFDTIEGFTGAVSVDEAGPRIIKTRDKWVPPVPAPIDIKSLNWSGHRKLANWDGNQGASARTLASGTSATGDPRKVNVRIHEPLNPLIENLPPPPYPFQIDQAKAKRGMDLFNGVGLEKGKNCAGCHKPNSPKIWPISKLGVDENRTLVNTDVSRYGLAALVMESCEIFMRKNPGNDWCLPRKQGNPNEIETDWDKATDDYFKDTPGRVRDEKNGYKVDMLHGIWARAPYLHNGSVPTLMHLLCPSTRPSKFMRGNLFYDQDMVGFEWAVIPRQRYSEHDVMQIKEFDTSIFSWSNKGHTFGSELCPDLTGLDPVRDREEITKRISESRAGDLLEYLKTM